jgi:hypothetical protein
MVANVGLTDAKIRGLKAPVSGQAEYADTLVPGLRLRVGSSGAKTFILRKRVGGRARNLTLDRYHERRFTLADARKKARALISDIEAGAEPQARGRGRRDRSTAGTVKALFEEYIKAKANLRSIAEIERIFDKYVLPEIGGRLADSVTRADITRLIDGIGADNGESCGCAAQRLLFVGHAAARPAGGQPVPRRVEAAETGFARSRPVG